MLLVKTKLQLSDVHGIGCFAAEFIPFGTVMWRFQRGVDLDFTPEEYAALPLSPEARRQLNNYSYLCKFSNRIIICMDDARFYNHSETQNTGILDDPEVDTALREIQAGEEILCNYKTFCGDLDLCEHFLKA